jgi:hypothetical protein
MLPQKGEINILCKGEVNGRTSIEAVEVWKPYPCKRRLSSGNGEQVI